MRLTRPTDVIEAVEWYCGVKLGGSATPRVMSARALAVRYMMTKLGMTQREIGIELGKDHATMMYTTRAYPVDNEEMGIIENRVREIILLEKMREEMDRCPRVVIQ